MTTRYMFGRWMIWRSKSGTWLAKAYDGHIIEAGSIEEIEFIIKQEEQAV